MLDRNSQPMVADKNLPRFLKAETSHGVSYLNNIADGNFLLQQIT